MLELLTLVTLSALMNYKENDKSRHHKEITPNRKEGDQNG